jgi:hypothetical protein
MMQLFGGADNCGSWRNLNAIDAIGELHGLSLERTAVVT